MVEKGQHIRARPPPLFGQCPKENVFFLGRCSLRQYNHWYLKFYLLFKIKESVKSAKRAEQKRRKMQRPYVSFHCDTQSHSKENVHWAVGASFMWISMEHSPLPGPSKGEKANVGFSPSFHFFPRMQTYFLHSPLNSGLFPFFSKKE